MERKILAAVDGSPYSFNALRYLSYLFTDLEEIVVHLLCVIPAGALSLGQEWVDEQDRLFMARPEVRKKLVSAKRFMEEAVLQLGRRGIAPAQVETSVRLSRMGVAADIMLEARQGLYDALLIGRRGIGKIEELLLGSSLSAQMAEKCYDLPLWVVDGKVNSRRFLLPVDSSFNSLKAADHLGFILRNNPYAEITLLHFAAFLGGDTKPDWEALARQWGKRWCDAHLRRPDSLYHGPSQMLIERGVPPEKISTLEAGRCLSLHKALIQTGTDNYGTIVIGRRAKAQKKGIFKGVSAKLLEEAKGLAIWVIG